MGLLSVIAAAAAAFVFGALWYGALSKPWIEASRVPVDADGKPVNSTSAVPYVTSAVCILIVAGFLRLTLDRVGVEGVWNAVQWGAGVGLFFITPWITLNNGYSDRPMKLSAIDGGYATIGCAIMGAVLWWLAPSV